MDKEKRGQIYYFMRKKCFNYHFKCKKEDYLEIEQQKRE